MLLFSSCRPRLMTRKLTDYTGEDYIRVRDTLAQWAESKWGYVRGHKGVEYRQSVIDELKEHFYIVTLSNPDIVVGMFALVPEKAVGGLVKTADTNNPATIPSRVFSRTELMYVYVEPACQGKGIGSYIVQQAKLNNNADILSFDTLNPKLNLFYQKKGARPLFDYNLLGAPTSVFRMG